MLRPQSFLVAASFVAVCFLVAVSGEDDLGTLYDSDRDAMLLLSENDVAGVPLEKLQDLLIDFQMLLETGDANGCSCSGASCSCCKRISVPKLRLNDNCCLNVRYLPRNYGILITLKFGSRTLFSKEISARNPPPACIGVPFLKKGGSVCVQFYNLNVAGKKFSGCARLLFRLLYVTVLKPNVGCFKMTFVSANATAEYDPAVERPALAEAEDEVQPMELTAGDDAEVVETSETILFFNKKSPVARMKNNN